MQIYVDLQNTQPGETPAQEQFQQWVLAALKIAAYQNETAELTIRIVDEKESQQLNFEYRQKNRPTNVLSFPFEAPADIPLDLLGDLIICLPVVEQEAKDQNKSVQSHWAHMVIHGTLHLLGFDHIEQEEAEHMESLEIQALAQFEISNPYLTE